MEGIAGDPPETFLERRRWDPVTEMYVAGPLRERFPGYLRTFGQGCIALLVVGFAVFFISSARLEHAIGYSFVLIGAAMLLFGGISGGGYGNLAAGAAGAMLTRRAGGRVPVNETVEELRKDPRERLRKGLRPPPNPSAFWTTMAGLGYILIGLPFTL